MTPEAKTRRDLIDPALRSSGWSVLSRAPQPPLSPRAFSATAVPEWPTTSGPADYALCDRGRLLAFVEAKKPAVGVASTLYQAERYAKDVVCEGPVYQGIYSVPFAYATNGHSIEFRDLRDAWHLPREVAAFHTPGALAEKLGRDEGAAFAKLEALPWSETLRPYQREAIEAVEGAVRNGKRKILLPMATGTGKTRTVVALVHRLLQAGVVRRVLFLVDRRALARQAAQAFEHYPASPAHRLGQLYPVYVQHLARDGDDTDFKTLDPKAITHPSANDAFVYVSTIQRMSRHLFGQGFDPTDGDEPEDDAGRLDIPIHAFDLVIADEVHRGYTAAEASLWRKTLDHFDAVRLGLTATPTQLTAAYFGTDLGFRYDYDRAVREGFLVDYDIVRLRSDVRLNGVFLAPGDVVEEIDLANGLKAYDTLEDERAFDDADVERRITVPASNELLLKEVKRFTDAYEEHYGRFPKTLIFAVNDLPHASHADALVEIARMLWHDPSRQRGPDFVRKITGRTDRPLQDIRAFRTLPQPGIVVTVDLLSTGVDVPDIECIVFLRNVKSRVLFEQMIGRGTRLGALNPPKTHFTVFDGFDGSLFERFRNATSISEALPSEADTASVRDLVDRLRQRKDVGATGKRLARRLARIEKETTFEGVARFGELLGVSLSTFAATLVERLQSDYAGTVGVLANPAFLDYVEKRPRIEKVFFVAPNASDTVTSTHVLRVDGKDVKPEDYLAAFTAWTRENAAKVDALAVLLDRPSDWSREELRDLRVSIKNGGFSEDHLRRAVADVLGAPRADMLSIVQHAADPRRPLRSGDARARYARDRAAQARAAAGQPVSDEQSVWLDRIAASLAANLSVDEDDFDLVPVLLDPGGLGAARRAFGSAELRQLLRDLNAGVADGAPPAEASSDEAQAAL